MQVSKRHIIYLAIVDVSLFFRPQQLQLKTKKKLFEPLTIQNNCEVTGSVTITTQKLNVNEGKLSLWGAQSSETIWTGSKWRKTNQWTCLLRTKDVKLFINKPIILK